MSLTSRPYGKTAAGEEVQEFTLRNAAGIEVRCINFGCRITHLFLPSADAPCDIVLGYDELAGYEQDHAGQGAFIGRYANRIKGAAFEVDGKTYSLTQNDGTNFLHGTFAKRVFAAEGIGDNSVSFVYTSPEGEDGFPGEVWVGVTYTLTDENELLMDYRAVSTADTHLNLTNHAYYNLAGHAAGTMDGQTLQLNASTFLEVDKELIPTGRILEVAGGAFDFTTEKPINRDIANDDPLLAIGGGYDNCYIVDKQQPGELALAAIARHPASGREMHIFTTQPAIQLYSSNFLNEPFPGKGGKKLAWRDAFCLETQHYPDAPHNPDFPSTLLRAGDKYHQLTITKFTW